MEHLTVEAPKTKEPWQMTKEEFKNYYDTHPDMDCGLASMEEMLRDVGRYDKYYAARKYLVREALWKNEHVPDRVLEDYPEVELDSLIYLIAKKGKLVWTGEALGFGKEGDVNLTFVTRGLVKRIGFLLEEFPEFANKVPSEIKELISGHAYEGIFEDLRKRMGTALLERGRFLSTEHLI